MQNGNATTDSSSDTPTYPWSSFFSGHPPTTDELPHRPRLTLYTSTTDSDEENIDPNDFINVSDRPTTQTTQEVPVSTTMEETQDGSQETSDLPVRTSRNGNPRPIPARNADDISELLPREVTPPSLPPIRISGEPIRRNYQDHDTDGPYHLMASFAAQNSTSENFSYKELATFTKIQECVTLVCITAKLQISLDEQQRIAKTWRLLMDYRITFVIARLARDEDVTLPHIIQSNPAGFSGIQWNPMESGVNFLAQWLTETFIPANANSGPNVTNSPVSHYTTKAIS